MNGLVSFLLMMGVIFIILGLILILFPPKRIRFYGYKTIRSMRNIETWKAGNKYSARFMVFLGIDLLILAGLTNYFFPDLKENSVLIGVGIIVVFVILLVALTENHLGRNFDKEGNRKTNV